ncbi:MAG: hypothetical protein K2F79_07890, partial [Muribaculaceae bacterium]|nr:hypothetical protein [Muribaculaceae bacterium]
VLYRSRPVHELKDQGRQSQDKGQPTLVDRARFESLAAYNDRIASLTDSLVADIAALRGEWLQSQNKNIDHEREIALFNNSPEKWKGVMERINQLSAIVLQ